MKPYMFEHFGNPSSIHVYGQQTRAAVDKARQQVASLINCQACEVHFTSCGTESDNWALFGAVMAKRNTVQGIPHVVTSQIEHPAITACLQNLASLGLCTYTAVPVSADGLVSADDVVAALTPQTVLVSVMHSNNEIGSLQPIKQIVLSVRQAAPDVLVHTDAAQSMGKVPVDVQDLGVDLLTLVGHKFGAPKGVAALYMRRGVHLVNLLSGGSQEQGKRGGTENVLLLSGIGAAAEIAHKQSGQVHQHMQQMKARLRDGLLKAFPGRLVRVNGPADPALQLPNTLSISIKGLSAPSLLQQLSEKLAASAGAACHSSNGPSVSPVLQAIHLQPEFAVGTLRLSTGRHTTAAEVDAAVRLIHDAACKQGLE
jgi:cysteine desulfurase